MGLELVKNRYLIKIKLLTSQFERISGTIARIDDLLWMENGVTHIDTMYPGEFIVAFYKDGFEEELICEAL